MQGRLLSIENSPLISGLPGRFEAAGLEVESFVAYRGQFPKDLADFDGVYISGSPRGAYDDVPWIHQEHDLIVEIGRLQIPTIGFCFGSQILASALVGRDQVFRRPTCEVGYMDLDVSELGLRDPLLEGVGERVHMFVHHNDEVRVDQKSMRILASSEDCPNHIWRLGSDPVWGVQGHPELTEADARRLFAKTRGTLLKDGADPDELDRQAVESAGAKRLVDNFIDLVTQASRARAVA